MRMVCTTDFLNAWYLSVAIGFTPLRTPMGPGAKPKLASPKTSAAAISMGFMGYGWVWSFHKISHGIPWIKGAVPSPENRNSTLTVAHGAY